MSRCSWVDDDPLMIDYHDREWGVPQRGGQQLFESLLLEAAQAGLSWRTILNTRGGYRAAFNQFSPQAMARLNEGDVARLLENPAIVRHRGKIEAFITNAQAYLSLADGGQPFEQFIWQFVEGATLQNSWQGIDQVPSQTPASVAMSKALKHAGFKFVGPTICYAFMQSAGLVNDHLIDCPRHANLGKPN